MLWDMVWPSGVLSLKHFFPEYSFECDIHMACLLHSPHLVDLGRVVSFFQTLHQDQVGRVFEKRCHDSSRTLFTATATTVPLTSLSWSWSSVLKRSCIFFQDTPPRPSWSSVWKRCHKLSRTRFASTETTVPLTSLSWSWSSVLKRSCILTLSWSLRRCWSDFGWTTCSSSSLLSWVNYLTKLILTILYNHICSEYIRNRIWKEWFRNTSKQQ